MRRITAVAAAGVLSVVGAAAQTSAPPRFTVERPVDTNGAGARRLQPDVALLSVARPFTSIRSLPPIEGTAQSVAIGGLSDLRLFDATGRDVPYVLVYPPQPQPTWVMGSLVRIPDTKKTSGFEADLGDLANVDAVRVNGIPAPFLKRLALEGSGDRQHWTVLQAEATLFDLPQERLEQRELYFQPGAYRYLRATWNDANSGKVLMPASVQARRVSETTPRAPLTAPLTVEPRASEPGVSRYRVRLPAGRMPIVALELQVTNDRVMRPARVTESRLAGSRAVPMELGRTLLRRVVQDGIAAEALRIAISSPAEAQLDLAVDDGSNPPLQLTGINAVFATLPFVYFEAGDAPIVARYGDPKLDAPRYDLEAARESIHIDTVADARWGETRALTPANATPAPVLTTAGAGIDASSFKVSRVIGSGNRELVALPLDPAALAHSRGPLSSFADVRVVDTGGRQVPYILEQRDEPISIQLPLRSATLQGRAGAPVTEHTSVYAITLPFAALPSPRVVLATRSAVFSRRLTLGVERPPDRRHRDRWFEVLASSDWAHNDDREPAAPLVLAFRAPDQTELRLLVDEGDNAPLPLEPGRLLLPAYALRFYRDASELRLVYGRDDIDAPQYDIQMLASEVMGHPAREVNAEPERAGAAAPARAGLVSPLIFWGVLGFAVLVLLGLVVRLVSTKS